MSWLLTPTLTSPHHHPVEQGAQVDRVTEMVAMELITCEADTRDNVMMMEDIQATHKEDKLIVVMEAQEINMSDYFLIDNC